MSNDNQTDRVVAMMRDVENGDLSLRHAFSDAEGNAYHVDYLGKSYMINCSHADGAYEVMIMSPHAPTPGLAMVDGVTGTPIRKTDLVAAIMAIKRSVGK